jgi:hypothetical protein
VIWIFTYYKDGIRDTRSIIASGFGMFGLICVIASLFVQLVQTWHILSAWFDSMDNPLHKRRFGESGLIKAVAQIVILMYTGASIRVFGSLDGDAIWMPRQSTATPYLIGSIFLVVLFFIRWILGPGSWVDVLYFKKEYLNEVNKAFSLDPEPNEEPTAPCAPTSNFKSLVDKIVKSQMLYKPEIAADTFKDQEAQMKKAFEEKMNGKASDNKGVLKSYHWLCWKKNLDDGKCYLKEPKELTIAARYYCRLMELNIGILYVSVDEKRPDFNYLDDPVEDLVDRFMTYPDFLSGFGINIPLNVEEAFGHLMGAAKAAHVTENLMADLNSDLPKRVPTVFNNQCELREFEDRKVDPTVDKPKSINDAIPLEDSKDKMYDKSWRELWISNEDSLDFLSYLINGSSKKHCTFARLMSEKVGSNYTPSNILKLAPDRRMFDLSMLLYWFGIMLAQATTTLPVTPTPRTQ